MCVCMCVHILIAQFCLTLCDPMDGGPLGFSVHEIFQARILEWVANIQGDLPNLGIEPESLATPALAGRFFIAAPQ